MRAFWRGLQQWAPWVVGAGGAAILMAIARHGRFARLVAPGVSYQLTRTDLLWLARSAACETRADPRFVLWTMIQRFVARRQRGIAARTLGAEIQRFSTPVQPGTPRPECRTATWTELETARPDVVAAVLAIGTGSSRSPDSRLTNFASTEAACARADLQIGNECFIRDDPPLRGTVRLG